MKRKWHDDPWVQTAFVMATCAIGLFVILLDLFIWRPGP